MNERLRYWGKQRASVALAIVLMCVACGGVATSSNPGTSRGGTSSADTSGSVLSAGMRSTLPGAGSGGTAAGPGTTIYEECGLEASCENGEITGMYGPSCIRLPNARCEFGCRQHLFDIVVFEFEPRTNGDGAAQLARDALCNQGEGGAGGDMGVAGDTGLAGEGGDRNVAVKAARSAKAGRAAPGVRGDSARLRRQRSASNLRSALQSRHQRGFCRSAPGSSGARGARARLDRAR